MKPKVSYGSRSPGDECLSKIIIQACRVCSLLIMVDLQVQHEYFSARPWRQARSSFSRSSTHRSSLPFRSHTITGTPVAVSCWKTAEANCHQNEITASLGQYNLFLGGDVRKQLAISSFLYFTGIQFKGGAESFFRRDMIWYSPK